MCIVHFYLSVTLRVPALLKQESLLPLLFQRRGVCLPADGEVCYNILDIELFVELILHVSLFNADRIFACEAAEAEALCLAALGYALCIFDIEEAERVSTD